MWYADFCRIAAKGVIDNAVNSEVSGPNATKIVHNVEIFILLNILKLELRYCNPFPNGSATKVDLSGEKRRFFDLPWQRPLKKKFNGMIKPLHPSTNPEILVKIGLLASESPGLRSRPLKNNKKLKCKETTSAKYIALPASLPSGLNYLRLDMGNIRNRARPRGAF